MAIASEASPLPDMSTMHSTMHDKFPEVAYFEAPCKQSGSCSSSNSSGRKAEDIVVKNKVFRQLSVINGEINRMLARQLKEELDKAGVDSRGSKDVLRKRLKASQRRKKLQAEHIVDPNTCKQHYTHLLVIDFEATCEEHQTKTFVHEIIEFPAVLVEVNGARVVAEFHALVRPALNPTLSTFCRRLTGITQDAVDGADAFPEVLGRFEDWLAAQGVAVTDVGGVVDGGGTKLAVATDGPWDMARFLLMQCSVSGIPFPEWARSWVNLRKIFSNFYVTKRLCLAEMLDTLGLEFQGRPHCGLDDARNIAAIAEVLLRDGAAPRVNETIAHLPRSSPPALKGSSVASVTLKEFESSERRRNRAANRNSGSGGTVTTSSGGGGSVTSGGGGGGTITTSSDGGSFTSGGGGDGGEHLDQLCTKVEDFLVVAATDLPERHTTAEAQHTTQHTAVGTHNTVTTVYNTIPQNAQHTVAGAHNTVTVYNTPPQNTQHTVAANNLLETVCNTIQYTTPVEQTQHNTAALVTNTYGGSNTQQIIAEAVNKHTQATITHITGQHPYNTTTNITSTPNDCLLATEKPFVRTNPIQEVNETIQMQMTRKVQSVANEFIGFGQTVSDLSNNTMNGGEHLDPNNKSKHFKSFTSAVSEHRNESNFESNNRCLSEEIFERNGKQTDHDGFSVNLDDSTWVNSMPFVNIERPNPVRVRKAAHNGTATTRDEPGVCTTTDLGLQGGGVAGVADGLQPCVAGAGDKRTQSCRSSALRNTDHVSKSGNRYKTTSTKKNADADSRSPNRYSSTNAHSHTFNKHGKRQTKHTNNTNGTKVTDDSQKGKQYSVSKFNTKKLDVKIDVMDEDQFPSLVWE